MNKFNTKNHLNLNYLEKRNGVLILLSPLECQELKLNKLKRIASNPIKNSCNSNNPIFNKRSCTI
jgi:hypothetical protein